jgi:hypothetical protein
MYCAGRANETGIGDDGLVHLPSLTKLTYLGLNGAQVTKAGLRHLQPLKELRNLDVNNTRVALPGR